MKIIEWIRPLREASLAGKHVRLYMGNEAGDLDSACCALAMSYCSQFVDPEIIHLPLFNFPQSHFNLKTEVRYALGLFDIRATDLFFRPDDLENIKSQVEKLEMVLVDHNNVVAEIEHLKDSIVRVIDHHRMVEPCLLPSDCDKIMKLVGSCSSLVAKFCSENVKKSDELCRLLAMAILIDTANFSPNQTIDDIDREQYSELTNQLQDWDKDSVYKKVVDARFDIQGLSIRELLLKDAKTLRCQNEKTIFAATLHCALDEMSNRDGCWNEIETFMNSTESNGADLLLMMGTVSNGENRGFGWWAGPKLRDDFGEKISAFLNGVELFRISEYSTIEKQIPKNSGLKVIAGSDGKVVSRKKALPIFLPWFEENY